MTLDTPARRGTSNGNQRGSSYSRRSRRAFLVETYASDVPGYTRCFRCGCLLYNPDDRPFSNGGPLVPSDGDWPLIRPLTVDRIIPGCQGGTYRRNNIRPACGPCNSELGGSTRRKKERK